MKLTEGPGERNLACADYSECLYESAKRGWKDFNCEPCLREKVGDKLYRVTKRKKEKKEEKIMEDDMGSITVKTKTCKVCGETRPLEEYRKHSMSPDGHVHSCPNCDKNAIGNKESKRGRPPKKKKPQEETKVVKEVKASKKDATKGVIRSPETPLFLNLDISHHPDLMEGLEKSALENFRPVEYQALFLLNEAVNGK